MSKNWQQFRAARAETLQNNPDFAREYNSLLTEMADQQRKMNAATIRIDAAVAPIIAKQGSDGAVLIPAEMRELNSAREAMYKANPELVADYTRLCNDMRSFQDRFSAAMLKTDSATATMMVENANDGRSAAEKPRLVAPDNIPK